MVRYTENASCAAIWALIFFILPIIAIVKASRNYSYCWWPSMWLIVLGVSMIVYHILLFILLCLYFNNIASCRGSLNTLFVLFIAAWNIYLIFAGPDHEYCDTGKYGVRSTITFYFIVSIIYVVTLSLSCKSCTDKDLTTPITDPLIRDIKSFIHRINNGKMDFRSIRIEYDVIRNRMTERGGIDKVLELLEEHDFSITEIEAFEEFDRRYDELCALPGRRDAISNV